jgi:peptide deformylase
MSLKMRYIGNPILRRQCRPVTEFGEELLRYSQEMVPVLHAEGGVGLAAPQVGLDEHFFIVILNVDDEDREEDEIVLMANVEILETSRREIDFEEGCLSVPGLRADVTRPEWVRISFQDQSGERVELETDGMLARVIQHENDHCMGILFVDRVSPARKIALKREIARIEHEYADR